MIKNSNPILILVYILFNFYDEFIFTYVIIYYIAWHYDPAPYEFDLGTHVFWSFIR